MSVHVTAKHLETAEKLVQKAHANGGLAPLDVEQFWKDNDQAMKDPWAKDCPQVPLGIQMDKECVFAELGLAVDFHKLEFDLDWRHRQIKAYNDQAEKIVGRRLMNESPPDPTRQYPRIKHFYEVFEAENVWNNESYWLQESAHNESELSALLDRVEKRLENLRAFMLPDNWDAEKRRLTALGVKMPLFRSLRGPITFCTSIYGAENLIYLIMDDKTLAGRFRDVLLQAILGYAQVLDEEAQSKEGDGRGWWWADDNCALLAPDMYEFFGYPIHKAIYDQYAPLPTDARFQHSDSDMGHLLPIFGRLGLTHVNFGPNLTVAQIREHLPKAIIDGQLAPFTFSRNEEVNMVAEFLRDYEMAKASKGLRFATAGSVNNGSRLTGLRLIMAAIQEYGRYQ